MAPSGQNETEYAKAIKKSLGILSFGDNSRIQLITKLKRAGISHSTASLAADEMVKLGYINESRQIERLIEREVNLKLLGPMKLIPKLSAKGYSPVSIKESISRLQEDGVIDFEAVKKKLTEGLPPDEGQKALYKKGHKV